MGQQTENSIGSVAEVQGGATVIHSDGSTEVIAKGTRIFADDTIETAKDGSVNITFNDGTIFVVSKDASMVIDNYVYDPNNKGEGDIDISVARGVFAYTSGFVGHEDPKDVQIATPVGSIGIRGTVFTASIPAENSGDEFKISILEGAIAVQPKSGGEFVLDEPRESLEIDPSTFAVTEMGILSPDQVMSNFNVIKTVAPELMAHATNAPQQDQPNSPEAQEGEKAARDAQSATEGTSNDAEGANGEESQATEGEGEAPTDEINLNDNQILDTDTIQESEALIDNKMLAMNADKLQMLNEAIAPASKGFAPPPPPPPMPPNTFDPSTSGGGAVQNNRPPFAVPGLYVAAEQAGIEGQTHSFNISKFFSDPDGSAGLSYTVVVTSAAGALASNPTVIGGDVFFTVSGALASSTVLDFRVIASDGQYSVAKDFQTSIYDEIPFTTPPPTAGDDVSNNTTGGLNYSMYAGNDGVTVNSSNNRIFGGGGDDSVTISAGNNNKFYGEAGNDTMVITTGNANLLSGGDGDDNLTVAGTGLGSFQLFGGKGNDNILIDANARSAFQTSSVIDGGTGGDLLKFLGAGVIDLTAANMGMITDIEGMDTVDGSVNLLRLDANDILNYNSTRMLFLDIEGNDNLEIMNAGMTGALTPTQTNVSNPHNPADTSVYSVYTFNMGAAGTATLYVDTHAGAGGTVVGI